MCPRCCCRVLVSWRAKINARHLDVDTQIPEGAVLVWGDPDSITQVCYNLLDNAIKFSAEGSTLGLSITTKGGKAYVSVRNTGQTIPPEELPLIFDRFHKSDKSRSVDREGVGLGLYIVKTILNSHKENITVSSENGVTEFVFYADAGLRRLYAQLLRSDCGVAAPPAGRPTAVVCFLIAIALLVGVAVLLRLLPAAELELPAGQDGDIRQPLLPLPRSSPPPWSGPLWATGPRWSCSHCRRGNLCAFRRSIRPTSPASSACGGPRGAA